MGCTVLCPLCGQRKARRTCPALGQQICAVCCGTRRLVEIACPPDCGYLTSAREHPPAAALRRRQQDLAIVVELVRDFNERQSDVFYAVAAFLLRYAPDDLRPLIDADVIEAAAALAATLETSARGVIYQHPAATLSAERLAGALRPLLAEAGKGGGTAFERDAAVVLRQIERTARAVSDDSPGARRSFLDLLGRVIRRSESPDRAERPGAGGSEAGPRLIVP
jgi:hypothetical protein